MNPLMVVGLFILGSFVWGFFRAMGADVYEMMRDRL